MSLGKNYPSRKISYRKIKNADNDVLIQDMHLDEILEGNLDELLTAFESNVISALDKHAPLLRKKIAIRNSKPWFDSDLKEQQRKVRDRERIWRKYKQHHQWLAFTEERKIYSKLLYKKKSAFITSEVIKYRDDSKHLYKLVSSLMGIKSENPMPECENDELLAERFC